MKNGKNKDLEFRVENLEISKTYKQGDLKSKIA